jgi:hypothetical protein
MKISDLYGAVQQDQFEVVLRKLQSLGIISAGNPFVLCICHDDWCGFLYGHPCDCEPEISDKETGRVLNPRRELRGN